MYDIFHQEQELQNFMWAVPGSKAPSIANVLVSNIMKAIAHAHIKVWYTFIFKI